jgi:hypothetical protein
MGGALDLAPRMTFSLGRVPDGIANIDVGPYSEAKDGDGISKYYRYPK